MCTLFHIFWEAEITPWNVPGAPLHVITFLVSQLLISKGICKLLEAKPRDTALHTHTHPTPTHLLVVLATTESGPEVACAGQHIPLGMPGFVRFETNPEVSDGPGLGLHVFPAQPQGLGPIATHQSAHLPGTTAPLTVERLSL